MAISKPGFTAGFRGHMSPPAWNRRAHYLAREEGRDFARLLGLAGQEIEPSQAIEVMGGAHGSYHEIIVAPSTQECDTIRARFPDHPQQAAAEAGIRVAKAYARGRPFVLAIHEQDGRFHFHVAVAGSSSDRALGKHSQIQKAWDQEIFGDEPRIQDWSSHLRFKEEKARLQQVIREQKENELQRREVVKRAAPSRKVEAARPFEKKARDLIERRYVTELSAIQARYEARGALESPRHKAELEQASHRRTGAIRRLECRETARELGAVKARLSRVVNMGGRVAQQGTRVVGAMARAAIDRALKEMAVPAPARAVARSGLAMGQEVLQTALRACQEAAKAATQSSVHIAQASMRLGIGLDSPSHGRRISKNRRQGRLPGSRQGRERAGAGGYAGRCGGWQRNGTRRSRRGPGASAPRGAPCSQRSHHRLQDHRWRGQGCSDPFAPFFGEDPHGRGHGTW